mmetsp:Transcript_18368/g.51006  ORF Transcript_18368/g.51006 Transcript_18368/m.51006 type:complete len:239 (+) Transcript_18368:1273-1989(+)
MPAISPMLSRRAERRSMTCISAEFFVRPIGRPSKSTLSSLGVPCKLVTGYSGDDSHMQRQRKPFSSPRSGKPQPLCNSSMSSRSDGVDAAPAATRNGVSASTGRCGISASAKGAASKLDHSTTISSSEGTPRFTGSFTCSMELLTAEVSRTSRCTIRPPEAEELRRFRTLHACVRPRKVTNFAPSKPPCASSRTSISNSWSWWYTGKYAPRSSLGQAGLVEPRTVLVRVVEVPSLRTQ